MSPRPIEHDPDKFYLGDGVFVMPGSYRGEIIITTEDGISEHNRVVLGPEELNSLNTWLSQWKFLRKTPKAATS